MLTTRTITPSVVVVGLTKNGEPLLAAPDPTIVFRHTKILVRPDGLLAAAPLVLRFAPDRRRLSGDVQPGAAPGCRTVLSSVGGSNYRQQIFRPNDRFSAYKNFGAPGRIRTADHCVRSFMDDNSRPCKNPKTLYLLAPSGT